MAQPSTAKKEVQKEVKAEVPPAKRMRAVKTAHNTYDVIIETFVTPSKTEVVAKGVDGVSAQYRCRLFAEEQMGPNRLGGSGL